jgi:hypothetical protein
MTSVIVLAISLSLCFFCGHSTNVKERFLPFHLRQSSPVAPTAPVAAELEGACIAASASGDGLRVSLLHDRGKGVAAVL